MAVNFTAFAQEQTAQEGTQSQEATFAVESSDTPTPEEQTDEESVANEVEPSTEAAAPNEDWSQATTEDPQFDIVVASKHSEIQDLLQKHLELYRYRTLSDLTSLELKRLLELTEDNIRDLTSTIGYFSPITTILVMPAEERSNNSPLPVVLIYVEPGEITKITQMDLNFKGHIEENKDEILVSSLRRRLRWGWAMRDEDPFTQSSWSSAKSNMLSRLTSQYYAAGKISASRATINPKENSAHLSITLDSGPRFYLGKHNIVGLDRYNERLVQNFTRLRAGDDFILDELGKAQQRLSASGYFDTVYLYVRPDDPNPEEAKINIVLKEAYYQKMTLGPGYSTDNGMRLTLDYRHNEVPLLGWQLVSAIKVDQDNQLADATLLSVPSDNYWRWIARGKLENEDKNNEKTNSALVSFGRAFTSEKVDTAYYLQYDKAKTENLDNLVTEDVQAFSLNTAWVWRNFDNVLMPRKGWGFSLELGAGSTVGNTSNPFFRTRLRTHLFLPLERWRSGRFIVRGELGGLFAKDGEPMPSTLLFRTGGDTSVRGYAHRYIAVNGLVAEQKATSSGRYMGVASLEYQRPIYINDRPTDFDWAVFIDTGAVSNKWTDLNLYTGVGAGVRWRSPVGPLNIDLGYGLKTSQLRLHFNIGFTF